MNLSFRGIVGAWLMFVLVSVACWAVVACSGQSGEPGDAMEDSAAGQVSIDLLDPTGLSSKVEPGVVLSVTAVVTSGNAVQEGVIVEGDIMLGGGSLDSDTAVTDADGHVTFEWTVGVLPIRAALRLSVQGEAAFVDHVVSIKAGTVIAPVSFGGVEEALAAAGIDGSTEGLAFDDSGNLWLGVPGNLVRIRMDAGSSSTSLIPVSGSGLDAPLGMAWDYLRKCLWIADKASIRRVTFDDAGEGGLTAVSHTVAGLEGLVTPNSVAIRDNRYVYFSDSCTGRVYRFEPDADTPAITEVASFDLAENGGPNGLAFDDSGRLWITTENVGLLCTDSGVDVTASVGGLYYVDIAGESIGQINERLKDFAMFGDGLAFDSDGNLYAIFDHFDGFNLVSSAVWLVPEEGEPVMVASVPIPEGGTAPDRLIANMAWGGDAFGARTVYFSLLAVPLVAATRGGMTADFGIEGRSLLPADLPD